MSATDELDVVDKVVDGVDFVEVTEVEVVEAEVVDKPADTLINGDVDVVVV